MSKKPGKKGKQDRIASNLEWMNTSLESASMDLDALASMPIKEVNTELSGSKAKSNASFIKELNGKLPEGISIHSTKRAPTKKRLTRKNTTAPLPRDRKPIPQTPQSSLRVFSIRNALILSGFIIALSLLGPYTIKLINQSKPEPAKDPTTLPDSTDEETLPATSLKFEFPHIKIRGVSYTLENFQGLVPQFSPLPSNPDSLDRTFTFILNVDSSGNVVGLQSEQVNEHPFERSIMDSLFLWRFYGGEASDTTSGKVNITYTSN